MIDLTDLLQRLLVTDVPPTVRASLSAATADAFVLADYNALLQVFRNIVRNALEAMSPLTADARLDIAIAAQNQNGGWLEVSIADNGHGFDNGVQERVFEPDFTSKPSGTGLGLAVARQTVRAHGGEIRAHARAAGGAEFVVKLPRAQVDG